MSARTPWPLPRRARRALLALLAAGLLVYLALAAMLWRDAARRLAAPVPRAADAVLVLGNRAYLRGRPNPCLTGRVDTALALARAGLAPRLVMSGGVDREDGRVEARVMETHARAEGYRGNLLLEDRAQSTRENLLQSWPLLEDAGVRRVIVVTEPFHLWRAQRLAQASGFDGAFEVQYAPAATSCWRRSGMLFRGALREPLAIINNALHGYL